LTKKPVKIGYARISTEDQNLDLQRQALRKARCRRIFEDRVSGVTSRRPGLDQALACLKPGDVLVVWKLDRLGRSLAHLMQLTHARGLIARGKNALTVARTFRVGRSTLYRALQSSRS